MFLCAELLKRTSHSISDEVIYKLWNWQQRWNQFESKIIQNVLTAEMYGTLLEKILGVWRFSYNPFFLSYEH